jgi:hypothetical protein
MPSPLSSPGGGGAYVIREGGRDKRENVKGKGREIRD